MASKKRKIQDDESIDPSKLEYFHHNKSEDELSIWQYFLCSKEDYAKCNLGCVDKFIPTINSSTSGLWKHLQTKAHEKIGIK